MDQPLLTQRKLTWQELGEMVHGRESAMTPERLRERSAQQFVKAWRRLFTEGEVAQAAVEYRQEQCFGAEGRNPPCANLRRLEDGVTYVCAICQCGSGTFATLRVQGKTLRDYPRYLMPDMHCPTGAIRPMPGTGAWPVIGSRWRVLRLLMRAAKERVARGEFGRQELLGAIQAIFQGSDSETQEQSS